MSLTRTASRSLTPLLGRLVLAAAFIPLGWEKIMGEERVYQGREAEVLQSLGIGGAVAAEAASLENAGAGVLARPQDKPARPDPPLTGTLGSRTSAPTKSGQTGSNGASSQPESKPKPQPKPPEPEPEPDDESSDEPAMTTAPPAPATPRTAPAAPPARGQASGGDDQTVRAKPMYQDAVLIADAGWGPPDKPEWLPVWGARAIAFLQLVGSGLLLVGIFARVWAVGLAVVVAVGFCLTSWATIGMYGITAPMPTADFNTMFSSLALFVFAVCLALTGAGSLSLDGMLFQGGDFDGDEHLI